jgi:alpha-methylacyl-CoA racemase
MQPNAAPRFSRTAGAVNGAPAIAGKHSNDVLESWGIAADRRDAFLKAGAVAQG